GIYKTDIKLIDDLFVIGDINQVRKIQGMDKSDIGGLIHSLNLTNLINISYYKKVRKIQGMDKSDIGGLDIYLKDIDDIDKEYPKIEELIG
ncbi:hypothetical protein GBO30_18070, partial [Elizabethkingia anophelis]|nr:hypothetical protein [Elizabethkingia anophelis]